jgi:SPP1 family predicted phage head-tail adaptor
MAVRSGALRHVVTFQQAVPTENGYGEDVVEWQDLTPDERVQIIPLKGEERYLSARLNTTVSHRIRMRYRADIDNKMRAVFGARIFMIDEVLNPYEQNRELQITATEVFDV